MKSTTMIKIYKVLNNTKHKNRSGLGFTLIELLVVIAIIGILASIVLASLTDVRKQARDSQRLSDMRQIRTAMELFYNANNRYPDLSRDNVSAGGEVIGIGDDIDRALRPYLNPIPKDPMYNVNPAVYFYSYDSLHNLDTNCDGVLFAKGVVFGFNKSEARGEINKDTCIGGDMNLNNADFNISLRRTYN